MDRQPAVGEPLPGSPCDLRGPSLTRRRQAARGHPANRSPQPPAQAQETPNLAMADEPDRFVRPVESFRCSVDSPSPQSPAVAASREAVPHEAITFRSPASPAGNERGSRSVLLRPRVVTPPLPAAACPWLAVPSTRAHATLSIAGLAPGLLATLSGACSRSPATTLRDQRGLHARLPALGRRVTRRQSC